MYQDTISRSDSPESDQNMEEQYNENSICPQKGKNSGGDTHQISTINAQRQGTISLDQQANLQNTSQMSHIDMTNLAIQILSTKPPGTRRPSDILFLKKFTQNLPFFDQMEINKASDAHNQCCKQFNYEFYKEGQEIIVVGGISDKFFLILQGCVQVIVPIIEKVFDQDIQQYINQKSEEEVAQLQQGEHFGDIGIIKDTLRQATIRAIQDCHLAVLSAQVFLRVLNNIQSVEMNRKINFLKSMPLFKHLTKGSLELVLFNFKKERYAHKQVVFKQDENAEFAYAVYEGEFMIEKKLNIPRENKDYGDKNQKITELFQRNIKKTFLIATISKGEMFGDIDCILNQKNRFTVSCLSETGGVVLKIGKKQFFRRLMEQSHLPEIQIFMNEFLEDKIRLRNEKIDYLSKLIQEQGGLFRGIFKDKCNLDLKKQIRKVHNIKLSKSQSINQNESIDLKQQQNHSSIFLTFDENMVSSPQKNEKNYFSESVQLTSPKKKSRLSISFAKDADINKQGKSPSKMINISQIRMNTEPIQSMNISKKKGSLIQNTFHSNHQHQASECQDKKEFELPIITIKQRNAKFLPNYLKLRKFQQVKSRKALFSQHLQDDSYDIYMAEKLKKWELMQNQRRNQLKESKVQEENQEKEISAAILLNQTLFRDIPLSHAHRKELGMFKNQQQITPRQWRRGRNTTIPELIPFECPPCIQSPPLNTQNRFKQTSLTLKTSQNNKSLNKRYLLNKSKATNPQTPSNEENVIQNRLFYFQNIQLSQKYMAFSQSPPKLSQLGQTQALVRTESFYNNLQKQMLDNVDVQKHSLQNMNFVVKKLFQNKSEQNQKKEDGVRITFYNGYPEIVGNH